MTLPALPDSFRWVSMPWGSALVCDALEAHAAHLFSTRQLELSSAGAARQLAEALHGPVAMLDQVHGREVVVRRRGSELPAERPRADALVTDDPAVPVAVKAADCVPLLMADTASGAVAAVHAGWRGTAAGTAVAALDAMRASFGTQPAEVVVAIGPCIGPCCYEVGSELVDAFAGAGHARYLIDRWFLSTPPPRGSRERAPLRLDLPAANRDQLILAGVPEAQIHVSSLCTAMHLDVLTSYRVERERAGRLVGAIRARPSARR